MYNVFGRELFGDWYIFWRNNRKTYSFDTYKNSKKQNLRNLEKF